LRSITPSRGGNGENSWTKGDDDRELSLLKGRTRTRRELSKTDRATTKGRKILKKGSEHRLYYFC